MYLCDMATCEYLISPHLKVLSGPLYTRLNAWMQAVHVDLAIQLFSFYVHVYSIKITPSPVLH